MRGNFEAPEEIGRWQTIALGIGGIATIVILIAAAIMPDLREQALRSWLMAFCLWGGIGIGSIGILLLQYLTGGAWGVVIRRICEAASRTLPVVFLLFLPILIGAGTGAIYAWTHPDPKDKIMQIRDAYLNFPFWALRTVLYFVLWYVMMHLLNKWSRQVDETNDWSLLQKASRFSGPTMVFFVLLVSFAAIDWTMSLDQHWYSTIWGLLYVVGWALASFAFAIVILAWLSNRAPMNRVVGKRHFHDLGKLTLALVMVWAYFNFSQFLIIWSGNLPEETQWYITRMRGGWGVIGVALILLHFAFPYLVLLSRDIKRNSKYLAALAIFILVMRLVDLFYMIAPAPTLASHGTEIPFHVSWTDFVAPIAVGGLWLAFFFRELRKRPLVPINDPFLENAIEHGKGH